MMPSITSLWCSVQCCLAPSLRYGTTRRNKASDLKIAAEYAKIFFKPSVINDALHHLVMVFRPMLSRSVAEIWDNAQEQGLRSENSGGICQNIFQTFRDK